MGYSKQSWSSTSYVTPTALNHMEDGIKSNSDRIDLFSGSDGNVTNLGASANANNLKTTGFYRGSGSNFPATSASFYVQVMALSSTNVKQIATAETTQTMYTRTLINGTWSAWEALATNSDLTNKIDKNVIVHLTNSGGDGMTTNTTDWEYLGTTITIPSGYVAVLTATRMWSGGRPYGVAIAVSTDTSSTINFLSVNQYDTSFVGGYCTTTCIVASGTYYLVSKAERGKSSENMYAICFKL